MVAYFILHRTLALDQNDTDQGHTVVELLQDVQTGNWMGWYGGELGVTPLGLFITNNLVDNGSLLLEGNRSRGGAGEWVSWVVVWHRDVTLGDARVWV